MADMEEVILESLVAQGYIRKRGKVESVAMEFWQGISWISVALSVLLFVRLIGIFLGLLGASAARAASGEVSVVDQVSNGVSVWSVVPPVLLLLLLIVAPIWMHKVSHVFSRRGEGAQHQVIGLYIFLKQAYKHRLETGELAASEIKKYAPYALAFGMKIGVTGNDRHPR